MDKEVELADALESNLDLLAWVLAPEVATAKFPPVYLAIFLWVKSFAFKVREFPQLAIGLPRGFAKTFLIKVISCYLIIFTEKSFLLFVNENSEKATSSVHDVFHMLQRSWILRLFGDWRNSIEVDAAGKKIFTFRNKTIILKGVGVFAGVRGIVERQQRPNVIFLDDIQSKLDSESETQSKKIESEMYGTIMKSKDPKGCLYIFIANMYRSEWSILRRIKKNPNWIKFIAGAILEDGSSLWEEVHPIAQLKKEFINDYYSGNVEVFFAEVQNDEATKISSFFDVLKVPEWTIQDSDFPEGGFVVVDPSGQEKTSDTCAFGAFKVYNGVPHAVYLEEGHLSPKEIIKKALNIAYRFGIGVVGYESVAFQKSLIFWHNDFCQENGILGIKAVPVEQGRTAKTQKILSSLRAYMSGEVQCAPEFRPLYHSYINSFDSTKTNNNDNILDLFTFALTMMVNHGELIRQSSLILTEESVEVVGCNSAF